MDLVGEAKLKELQDEQWKVGKNRAAGWGLFRAKEACKGSTLLYRAFSQLTFRPRC